MLQHLNANPDTVTVSGFSAGCFMAHRMSVIYSESIQGASLFACWPYAGAYDGHDEAPTNIMARESENEVYRNARYYEGLIDDPDNIAD